MLTFSRLRRRRLYKTNNDVTLERFYHNSLAVKGEEVLLMDIYKFSFIQFSSYIIFNFEILNYIRHTVLEISTVK